MAQNTAQYTTVHRKRRLQHSLDDLNLGNFLRQAAINFQSLPTLLRSPPSAGALLTYDNGPKRSIEIIIAKKQLCPKNSLICDMSNFATDGMGDPYHNTDGVGDNFAIHRWFGWLETGRRCRSQGSSPTTYLRCPYGARRRFKRRYILGILVVDIFWYFPPLSHISKERQKFHDIDSEEFQLYKHAAEEEYRMQVFCDHGLISSMFMCRCRRLPMFQCFS